MFKGKSLLIGAMLGSALLLPDMAVAKNAFLVAPGRLQIDVEELKTQSFIVTNTGENQIRLDIKPIYLPIDDSTLNAGEHLSDTVSVREDISSKVRVSPRRLSLLPGQRRDVRVQIRPLENPQPGDYRAHILVKMNEASFTSTEGSEGSDGMSMKLDVNLETAVAVYGRKGDPVEDLNASCDLGPQGQAKVELKNASNWRFEGLLFVDDMKPDPIVLLRESKKTIELDMTSVKVGSTVMVADMNRSVVLHATCSRK